MPGQAEERPGGLTGQRTPTILKRGDRLEPVQRRPEPCRSTVALVRGCNGSRTGSPSLLSSSRMVRSEMVASTYSSRLGIKPRDDLLGRILIRQYAKYRFDDRVTG